MKELYNALFENGDYTGTFEEFKDQFGDTDKSKGLYEAMNAAGDYTGTVDEFNSQFEFEAKTEAVAEETADVTAVEETVVDTDLESENGSLESQEALQPFVVNGEVATEEEFNNFKNSPADLTLQEKKKLPYAIRQQLSRENNFTRKRLAELTKKTEEDVNEAKMSFGDKLVVDFQKGSSTLGEMMASVPETIYNIFSIPQNLVALIPGLEGAGTTAEKFKDQYDIDNSILSFYEKESKALSDVQDIYNNENYDYVGIYKNFSEGNIADGFKQMASGITESAPVSISMMVGGAAVSTTGATGLLYSNAAKETAKLAAGSTVAFAGPEIKEQILDNPGQSELASVMKGLGIAGAESVFSSIGSGTLGKVYKDVLTKEGKEVGVKVFKDGLIDMYRSVLKKAGAPAAMAGEGVEEVATSITQNMIKGLDPFQGVADAFLSGVGGGGFYGAPVNVAQGISAVKGGLINVKINKELKNSSNNSIVEAFSSDSKITSAEANIALIPGAYEALNKKVDLEVKSNKITKEKGDDVKNNFRNTQSAANTVEKTNIVSSDKAKAIDLLIEKKKRTDNIKAIDDSALTRAESDRVEVINKELEAIVKTGEAVVNKDLLETNINTVKDQAKNIEGLEIKDFANAEDINAFVKEKGLKIDKKAFDNQGFIYQDPNTGEQTIVINREIASKEKAVNVASHEFLHGALFNTLKNSPDTQTALGVSLKATIDNIDLDKVSNSDFAKRLEQYAGEKENIRSEEVLTLFSDALATGDIKFNENIFTKIGDVVRRSLQKIGVEIKFNNGRDVYNFVKDYNNSISKGKLNKSQIKAANKGVKGKLVSEAKEITNEINVKESKSADKAKTAFEAVKFENLKKPRAQGIIGTELPGMVRAQVFNKYSGLGNQKIQDFTDEVVERIYAAKENEKWGSKDGKEMESKGSLYGFINGRINMRIKDVVKKEYSRDPLERLYFSGKDGNQFDSLENAADVAVEETSETIEKPKYKNLLESKVLSSDVLKGVKDKVLKTVRTLKSRMDAKVSLNKTITPLVSEIKKNMGKQADIDLKKAMGSKKDGQLKNFLVNNKKSILENMTTTWLMGAMPGAIQKQVDGKFTSDWQGKKIDRETVNTNNAGKTSGAEIVRRLPNASQNISDEVFLSYILDDKGNPIRGRKESLAKALAEEVSFDIFNQQLKNPESDISKAFENNQEAKGVVLANDYLNKVKKDIERGTVKFSLKNNIFIENQNFLKVNTEFAAENKQWKAVVRAFGLEPLNMKTEADRVLYRGWIVGELSKYLPKTFFENNGTFTGTTKSIRNEQNEVIGRDYGGNYAFLKNEDLNETLNKISNFAKPSKSIEAAVKKQTYSNIEAKLNDSDFNNFQDLKIDGLKDIFLALEAMIKENPANIPFVAAMLSSTSAYQGHFIRVAAPIRFYTTNVDGKFVEEHTLPASLTAKYLFKLAVQGKINESFSNIKKNYFQGALAKSYDDILKGVNIDGKPFNYKETPPEGWVLTDNIWARYFNNNVAGNDGGVLPQNIMLANGISAIKKFGINSSGYKIPKAIADVNYKKLAEFQAKQKVVTSEANKPTVKLSMKLNKDFNDILERNKGVASEAEFSRIVAKRRGASIGKFKIWMPSSLNDFKGLTSYTFAGKGRQGDADQKFFKETLLDPYFKGIAAIETSRQTLKNDFVALNKMFKPVVKNLGNLIENGDYTNDQAIRVYLWNKAGFEIPGLSKRDQKKLLKHINENPDLKAYADGALLVSKQKDWIKPGAFWDAQTILSDLGNMTEKVGRKEYIAEFIENADIIFSEANLNKIEALYGTRHRDALEDLIYRMKNGTNRPAGASKNQNIFNNWVNNSIGAIMFFNRRSALLQTLSTVNFLNWSDNNPVKAAAAFANQPQYWKDFSTIFNSAKLKQRRSGLKSDINEAEIASAVKGSKNKATAALSWLLKKGFLPTQMADSFAIAAGGATFYRNRINTLMKKGMSKTEAETKAFSDFSEISEETQQSGDPALISSDQASVVGRLLLAFQNTPIQLNRSIKKSAQDIYNRRRMPEQTQMQSDFSNISKIVYYGAIQNIIFTSLSNALFALLPGFDDDEPTEEELQKLEEKKLARMANGIIDTTLKGGFGLPGAVLATIKNVIMEYNKQDEKGFKADHTYTILQAANLAPPIGSKLGKIYSGIQGNKFNRRVIEKRGFDVKAFDKFNLSPKYSVWGKYIEGTTNLPLGRAVDEINAIVEAFDTRNTTMQRVALGLGWRAWDVGAENEENDLIGVAEKAKKGKEKKKSKSSKKTSNRRSTKRRENTNRR